MTCEEGCAVKNEGGAHSSGRRCSRRGGHDGAQEQQEAREDVGTPRASAAPQGVSENALG